MENTLQWLEDIVKRGPNGTASFNILNTLHQKLTVCWNEYKASDGSKVKFDQFAKKWREALWDAKWDDTVSIAKSGLQRSYYYGSSLYSFHAYQAHSSRLNYDKLNKTAWDEADKVYPPGFSRGYLFEKGLYHASIVNPAPPSNIEDMMFELCCLLLDTAEHKKSHLNNYGDGILCFFIEPADYKFCFNQTMRPLLDGLIIALDEFKKNPDKTQLDILKSTVSALFDKELPELKKKFFFEEKKYHAVLFLTRAFFRFFDHAFTLFSNQTMNETSTPLAKAITGRLHFFELPESRLSKKAMEISCKFKQTVGNLESKLSKVDDALQIRLS